VPLEHLVDAARVLQGLVALRGAGGVGGVAGSAAGVRRDRGVVLALPALVALARPVGLLAEVGIPAAGASYSTPSSCQLIGS
jgi:hypothetical protein